MAPMVELQPIFSIWVLKNVWMIAKTGVSPRLTATDLSDPTAACERNLTSNSNGQAVRLQQNNERAL